MNKQQKTDSVNENTKRTYNIEAEIEKGQAPTPAVLINKCWNLVSTMVIVATQPHVHQELLRIGVNGDAVSINRIRILHTI